MSSLRRAMIIGVGATASLLALGFVHSRAWSRASRPTQSAADGIVVSDREGRRIAEAARLLDEGRASAC